MSDPTPSPARPSGRTTKPRKTVIRRPKFKPGDCLSIHLPDGRYAAALVLAADDSNPEHGLDLIAVLDFLSPDKPPIDVFRERKWLEVAWYHYMGFRAVKQRLDVVGAIEILESDPKDSNVHHRWNGIGEQAISRK